MRLARELRSPLTPTLVLLAAALFVAREPGDSSIPWLGIAALALAGVLFATRTPPGGLLALVPLGALAAWSALSIAWSIEPDRSWSYSNRAFVYLAFALVGALAGLEPGKLLYGFAGLLGAVVVWSLAGKALPWLHEGYGGISRLSAPVGYWNSLALLGDIALPIGLCLATRRRVAGTLLVFGWLVAIGLTYSRGGVVVGLVVVGLWMLLSKAWVTTLSTLLAAGLPAAGALAVAFSLSGLTSDGQPHLVRARDGAVFGVVVILLAFIAAELSRSPLPATDTVRRASMGVLVLAVAVVLAVGGVHARTWWNDLTHPATSEVANTSNRFTAAGSNLRSAWWREAVHGFEAAPVKGTGAGSFEFTNLRYRTSSVDEATEPHDLPLQFLSETGVVGLVLFLGAIGWLVAVGRRRPGPQLALALALPAYFLHGLIDIDWDFVSVSGPVFLIAGALAVRRGEGPRPSLRALLAAGAVLVAVAASLGVIWLAHRWEGQAQRQAGAATVSANKHALTLARRAHRLDPLDVDSLFTEANAELGIAAALDGAKAPGWRAASAQATARAAGYLTDATRSEPDNPQGFVLLGLLEWPGCPRAAYTAFDRLTVLDPQGNDTSYYFQKALAIVNSGKAKC